VHLFAVIEHLDRFDVDVMEKPFFLLLRELSNFIRNHLHLKVRIDVGLSDITRHINDVPKYLVLKSLNDISVALFRASPQLYAVCAHRLQYLFVQLQLIVYRQSRFSSHEPIHFLVLQSKLFAFFLDMCLPGQFGIQPTLVKT
jgi:hypothetical protein